MDQTEWGSRMRRSVFLFLLKEANKRQAYAALGACDALAARVQFSWADHAALLPGEMFTEKLK